jgi:phenylacetate-CoA ligase
MTDHYDALETRAPAMREAELFSRLPDVLRKAMAAPAYAERFQGIDPAAVTSRAALARLPVLRKADLPALHKASPPFGGFVTGPPGSFGRLFTSPGPIFEPEAVHADPWRGARALFAAGFRPGDVVLNTFSYHLTPGGFIFDASARSRPTVRSATAARRISSKSCSTRRRPPAATSRRSSARWCPARHFQNRCRTR